MSAGMRVEAAAATPRAAGAMSRRAVLKLAGLAAALPWLSDEGLRAFAQAQESAAAPALRVLSTAQHAALEALTEAIIPADERSPGAKEARVAEYIDLLLSELPHGSRRSWLDGLQALDATAESRHGAPFARLPAEQADTLLAELSRGEADPQTPPEAFFKATKNATIRGYYSSRVGIHQELRYEGNRVSPAFVGCLTQDGQDCPHCGQKA